MYIPAELEGLLKETKMDRTKMLFSVMVLVGLSAICVAADLLERETLTEGMWGLQDMFAEQGMTLDITATTYYLQSVRGQGKREKESRFTGTIDTELTIDTEKVLGIANGTIYLLAATDWSKRGAQDDNVGGTVFGIGGGGARNGTEIVEYWYEHAFENGLNIRAGKIDLTGGFECRGCPVSFDGNSYANSGSSQFQNGALGNNPTIPFPGQGVGVVAFYNPTDLWYASIGIADNQDNAAHGSRRFHAGKSGLGKGFHDEDWYLYIAEVGVTPQIDSANGPMQGAYRFGVWNDPQARSTTDAAKTIEDNVGYYVSFDQMVCKENSDPEDGQGAGVFFRYGYADSKAYDINNFFSVGFQYQGLIDGRDDDVLGIGFAHGQMSDNSKTTYTDDYEAVWEAYYNIAVSPWLNISPSIQYVQNPGAIKDINAAGDNRSDAIILGLRAQVVF
jgi:carbohydrate-selective porin OprB